MNYLRFAVTVSSLSLIGGDWNMTSISKYVYWEESSQSNFIFFKGVETTHQIMYQDPLCFFFFEEALEQFHAKAPERARGYLPYIRPMEGDISPKHGPIWYSTSVLGSWISH